MAMMIIIMQRKIKEILKCILTVSKTRHNPLGNNDKVDNEPHVKQCSMIMGNKKVNSKYGVLQEMSAIIIDRIRQKYTTLALSIN